MIQNFFYTIQQDIVDVATDFKRAYSENNAPLPTEKVRLSALRVLATLTMGRGLLVGLSAISAATIAPTSAVFTLAWGVTLYVLGYDVFIMARNRTEEIDNLLVRIGNVVAEEFTNGPLNNLINLVNRRPPTATSSPFSYQTRDTFLQPLWIALLPRAVPLAEQVALSCLTLTSRVTSSLASRITSSRGQTTHQ